MASAGLKRLRKELKNAIKMAEEDPSVQVRLDGDSLNEWHFIMSGCPETVYEGGLYWGKIVFPEDYPVRPPAVYFFTPNGRYEIDTRLCLRGISDYHSEDWSPAISIVSLLRSVRQSMRDESVGIGSITQPAETRILLARRSMAWNSDRPDFQRLFAAYAVAVNGSRGEGGSPPAGRAEVARGGAAVGAAAEGGRESGAPSHGGTRNGGCHDHPTVESDCRHEVHELRLSQVRNLCRLLGHGFGLGPLEAEDVRRQGVVALMDVLTAANSARDGSDAASADGGPAVVEDGAALQGMTGPKHRSDRLKNEADLFKCIEQRDLCGIDRLCAADPMLVHVVRHDGKTPAIVAAITSFADGVWYFVERGAAFKHHSSAGTGFSGHHVQELNPCEDELECLADLGCRDNPVWTASEVVSRLEHATALLTMLEGSPLRKDREVIVPLPQRRGDGGATACLRRLHQCARAIPFDGTDEQMLSASMEATRYCRYLVDLALTYPAAVSERFAEHNGVDSFSRILDFPSSSVALAEDASHRLHVMALTALHICLHIMKVVRGGQTDLLDKILAARMPVMLMKLGVTCDEVALSAIIADTPDRDDIVDHLQRTIAVTFQSLTEISFNSFDSGDLTTSFPEDLVKALAMRMETRNAKTSHLVFLTDESCAEMVAWWLSNLLDAGLFKDILETKKWALHFAMTILSVHENLRRAESLREAAVEYGTAVVTRAACDGNVTVLLDALEEVPDAMFKPNALGQPALMAAASTGNKSVCDCLIILVERGSALKYHENIPNKGRHHVTKFAENEALFEDLAALSEDNVNPGDRDYIRRRAELIARIRALFAPPCMEERRFEELVAARGDGRGVPDDVDDKCFLCGGSVSGGDAVPLLQLQPCGHWHHADCVKQWLLKNRATCPTAGCDKATKSAWPDPPPPPRLPADGVKKAIDMLVNHGHSEAQCALALRVLADCALTHRRRAARIFRDLRALDLVPDVCDAHAHDCHVLYAAALLCLEIVIALKGDETLYTGIGGGTIVVIRRILGIVVDVDVDELSCDEHKNWTQVVERSVQVLAELSLSPQLPEVCSSLLWVGINSFVLRAVDMFPGTSPDDQTIRLTEIFLVKVMMQTRASGDEADLLAEDCFAKTAVHLIRILREHQLGDLAVMESLLEAAGRSRDKVNDWLLRTEQDVLGGSGDGECRTVALGGAAAAAAAVEGGPLAGPTRPLLGWFGGVAPSWGRLWWPYDQLQLQGSAVTQARAPRAANNTAQQLLDRDIAALRRLATEPPVAAVNGGMPMDGGRASDPLIVLRNALDLHLARGRHDPADPTASSDDEVELD